MRTKSNIAIVYDGLNQVTSGAEVSTLRFSELLSKRGYKVIIISSKNNEQKGIELYKGIKVYRLAPGLMIPKTEKKLVLSLANSGKIKKILSKEKINIVHFMWPTPLGLSAVRAAKKLNLKVVAHSHAQLENIEPFLPKFMQKDSVLKFAYKYIVWCYNKADFIVCPSKFAENLLKKAHVKTKTVVISNGVDFSKFKKIKVSERDIKKFGMLKNSKKIIFVGRLDPEKNISLLIKAVPEIEKKFSNFEVGIVGKGTLRQDLENLSNKIGAANKVRFLGKLSDEDLIKAYNLADIFVLPSLCELEGMAVLEAMACGKPVLVSNAKNSASKYLVNKNGFLFNPRSAKDLAIKCLKLLKNQKLLNKMANASFKESRKYDINKSVSKLESLYYSLLNK